MEEQTTSIRNDTTYCKFPKEDPRGTKQQLRLFIPIKSKHSITIEYIMHVKLQKIAKLYEQKYYRVNYSDTVKLIRNTYKCSKSYQQIKIVS